MRKLILTCSLLIFGLVLLQAQTVGKKRYLKPKNHTQLVSTMINGKTRSYYDLSTTKASVINVKGPGVLRVMTRGALSGSAKKVEYEIKYVIDGGEEKTFESGKAYRADAKYKDASRGKPGHMKDFEIVLSRGDHTIEFFINDEKVPVAARYVFQATKPKKQKWLAYSPKQPSEPVDLVTRETVVKYYRFSNPNPLKVEVCGPTQLRMLSRIENHYQMKGRIHYRIQVKEDGKVINTYQLSSRRSEVTVYKKNKELVPGKGCEFLIDVPEGKHTYEILPLDKDKSTILGRFLLPEKAVKLVE